MASRTFLNQMREIHGEESPWWRSNILGIFPGQESVRFLPSAWLDACTRESVPNDELWADYPAGSAFMGVDIGGGVGADRSVVVVRNQKQVLAVFASEWHGVLDEARHRLEPVVVELARKWGVTPERLVYDKAGIGRSFGSYLASHGFEGAVGYFGAGKGGKLYVNRRTANAFALKRRLDPHRENHVPFYCGGIPEWPGLRQELAELRSPTMEIEEGQVKQVLEDKEALAARLHRSPDLLDALLDDVHVLGPGISLGAQIRNPKSESNSKNEKIMDQPFKHHPLMTERLERLQIENYALLTESATDLRARLQEWYGFYVPESPGVCDLMEMAVMSSIQWRRVLGHMTEAVNHRIRTAFFDFDCAHEDEVQRYRAMLATSPGAAILGLKRSALGVRYLIMRWERLESLLLRDGTWYGGDRNEAINCQGARADPPESLSESEAGYLTWLYCLMAQPAPKDQHFFEIGREN